MEVVMKSSIFWDSMLLSPLTVNGLGVATSENTDLSLLFYLHLTNLHLYSQYILGLFIYVT
jgi:hypothetical protein